MQVLNSAEILTVSGGIGAGALTGFIVGGELGLVPGIFLAMLGGRDDQVLPIVFKSFTIPAAIGFTLGAAIDWYYGK